MSEPSSANFPDSIANDTSLLADPANLQQFVLDGDHNDSITTISVTSVIAGVTAPGYIRIGTELIHFTGISSADFTGCTRGADGTVAAAHSSAAAVYSSIAANYWKQMKKEVIATQTFILGNAGWLPANETWTYASATTFTITGDKTDKYSVGMKLKLTQTTVKYFYVVGVSYSDPNTTVTIAQNTDYTFANAAATDPYYSGEQNPVGFPHWFNYAPTYGGFSTPPSSTISRFRIEGRTVFVHESENGVGTSNATTFTISLPVQAKTQANSYWMGACGFVTGGTPLTGACRWSVSTGGTTVSIYANMASAAFSGSGDKRAYLEYYYEI